MKNGLIAKRKLAWDDLVDWGLRICKKEVLKPCFARSYAHDWNKRNAGSLYQDHYIGGLLLCLCLVCLCAAFFFFFFLAGLIVLCLILNKFLFQQKIWHVIFPVIGVYQSTFLAVIN